MIFWAGRSSDDVHVIVEHYPSVKLAGRKMETQAVPGRSGDLLFTQNAFENYVQPYDIYVSAERIRLPRAMREVAQWLCAPQGYQRLEDSYDLDTYRLAYYSGTLEVESILHKFGRATIEFNCKPQRYLRSGDTPTQVTQGQALLNPTAFTALPLITVTGTGAGTLTVSGVTVTINSMPQGAVVFDSDTQNAYYGDVNLNGTISAPEFPQLVPGDNTVSWTGAITGVEIVPKWWTL